MNIPMPQPDVLPPKEAAPGFERRVRIALTIQVERSVVAAFCAEVRNLTALLPEDLNLEVGGEGETRLVVRRSDDKTLAWSGTVSPLPATDAIEFRPVVGSEVKAQGRISFLETAGGTATEVHLLIDYVPLPTGWHPLHLPGHEGDALAIKRVLRNLRAVLECGEVATIKGQPRGR